MRKLFAPLALVILATGCSDGETASTPPTTAPSTTTTSRAATTTSTTAPMTTTTRDLALAEVPLPDVKIDDADEAFRRIRGFIDDLSRNPQPELLELYYDPACSAHQSVLANFTRLVENGWRYAGLQPTEIPRNLVVFQNETEAQLQVTYVLAADEVYDAHGNLVREDPEQEVENGFYMTKTEEFGWRICEISEVVRQ